MRHGYRRSLGELLDGLSRRDCLQVLAYVEQRKAQMERLQVLLVARLIRLLAELEPLLTVAEVAKRLSAPPGRVYELIRQRLLATVRIGEKQLRISAHAVNAMSASEAKPRKRFARKAVLYRGGGTRELATGRGLIGRKG